MKLITAKPDHNPSIFIQSKGLHSGRPLKRYIPNSFALYTQDPDAFEKCYIIYLSGIYKQHLMGSVIPFIRLHDTLSILEENFQLLTNLPQQRMNYFRLINSKAESTKALLEHVCNLRVAFAHALLHKTTRL